MGTSSSAGAASSSSSGGASSSSGGLASYLVNCDTLFAARILEKQIEIDSTFPEDCDIPLRNGIGELNTAGDPICTVGESPNACRTRVYETPPDLNSELDPACNLGGMGNCMRGKWLPRCADGTDDSCTEPEVTCVDGTRPMVYIEPATTGPSNKWVIWMSGQGSPCHGENCWVHYRYMREIGENGAPLSQSALHPDFHTPSAVAGVGIVSGAPSSGANPFAGYNRVHFNRCSDSTSNAVQAISFGNGISAEWQAMLPMGATLPLLTRESTTYAHHGGSRVWKALLRMLATNAGRDLNGDGTPDIPSLADAEVILNAATSDASHWLVFAADGLTAEAHAVAGAETDVRLLVDGFYPAGLDGEARFHSTPPAGFNVFSHPYTVTGLCELPDNNDGIANETCSDTVYTAGQPPPGARTSPFTRTSMEVRGTVLDASCEAFHGAGAPPCYDKVHTLHHHVSTPWAVIADQEDSSIGRGVVLYADVESYGWETPEVYRARVLAQGYDVQAHWTTGREEGAAMAGDVLMMLRKSRRNAEPWGAAIHTHFEVTSKMQFAMSYCTSAAAAPTHVMTIANAIDRWATGAVLPAHFIMEDAATWDGSSPFWVTGDGCRAPE